MAEKNSITFEFLMGDLANKIYHPVYLLHGEEPYFIDAVSDYIEGNVLSETEREFNQTIVYGRDTDIATLTGYARRYPMMANYQVLIVKEAQDLNRIEELQSYVEKPLPSTILVLCHKYGKLDERKGLARAIKKSGIIFESARLYDNKVPDWIGSYLRQRGHAITPKAAALLTEFLGADLGKIANELEKLLINLPAGARVDEDSIERNIGISKDYNVFELQKALALKDSQKAYRIVFHFAANPKENPLPKVIPMLYSFFSKVMTYHFLADKSQNAVAAELSIRPFFVNDYQQAARNFPPARTARVISLLREYDLKAKGVDNLSAGDGELMKELVFKILQPFYPTR